ncbi:MAG: hypothetical protein JO249_22550 [Acidobacteria bacterium]|nr:hypothetical protein [Acidobacteriota bacterium]
MTEGLSRTYTDLLEGEYDCLDRIVLNAYFRFAHSPGGFRAWWRQLYGSDEHLDNAHLTRKASQFSHRVRRWAREQNIPMRTCRAGQTRYELAQRCLQSTPIQEGLFLILVGRAPAPLWEVLQGGYLRRKKPYPFVNHFSFPRPRVGPRYHQDK